MDHGGRFYGDFQTLPRAVRKRMTINGQPVVEPDYSGLHIRMLYHKLGLDFRDECYVYNKNDWQHTIDRERMKLASLIIINADDRKKAANAIFFKLGGRGIGCKTGAEIEALMQLFEEHHKPIKKFFYSDEGVRLQFLDSEIMHGVLKELVRLKVPALPVHDSVVVPIEWGDLCKQVMGSEYKMAMGFDSIIG